MAGFWENRCLTCNESQNKWYAISSMPPFRIQRTCIWLFIPLDGTIGGILILSGLFVCWFVCLSVVNFNLRHNFWTVRERLHIWHAYSTCPFKWDKDQLPCDLDFDFCPRNSFFRLLCPQGHSVSQTHVFFLFWFINNKSKKFVVQGHLIILLLYVE